MTEEAKKQHNIFLYLMGGSSMLIILAAFYFLYFKKDYNFIVETSCDKNSENCFYRDCATDGNCPPSEIDYYNKYMIKARDFKFCTGGDCALACKEGTISCVKEECTEKDFTDGMCLAPEITTNTNTDTMDVEKQ